jgi:hypothetical protein
VGSHSEPTDSLCADHRRGKSALGSVPGSNGSAAHSQFQPTRPRADRSAEAPGNSARRLARDVARPRYHTGRPPCLLGGGGFVSSTTSRSPSTRKPRLVSGATSGRRPPRVGWRVALRCSPLALLAPRARTPLEDIFGKREGCSKLAVSGSSHRGGGERSSVRSIRGIASRRRWL